MKNLDLSKLFGSKCRAKILERFFLELEAGDGKGFHMRALSRDLDEQINSIKRELDNLSNMGILKYREELRKKIFSVNTNFLFCDELKDIFLKSYNPIDAIRKFFKTQNLLEVIIVNESVKRKLMQDGKNILDIFLIGEIDKDEFNEFMGTIFYNKKVKYAIISTEDFYNRLEYGDKLIQNILKEKGNVYLKDALHVKEKF